MRLQKIETHAGVVFWVIGCKVNYDQVPRQVIQRFDSSPVFSEEKFSLRAWSGDKSGVLENVKIPIILPPKPFSTEEGRDILSDYGYGVPAELASFAITRRIRQNLWREGVASIVVPCASKEVLYEGAGEYLRVVYLDLVLNGFRFGYNSESGENWWRWNERKNIPTALLGAPQLM